MSWLQIWKQELHQMFIADRKRAIFIFGAPLAYLLLFSLLYGTHTIKAVPLVVYDEDQTQFSRTLIQALDDSERFRIIDYAASQESMEQNLRDKAAYAAVHIPNKFAQDAKSGRSATVLLLADGANILITNTVTTAVQEIVAGFAKETGAKLVGTNTGQMLAMAANKTAPVELRLRVLNNPTQSYLSFFVLGLAMAALQQGIFLAVGAGIHHAYQQPGEGRHSRPWTLLLKLFPYWVSGTLAFFITIIASVQLFGIPGKAAMLSLLPPALTFAFAAVAFSAFLASVCNTKLIFTRLSIAYTVPAFVLSGYTWPLEAMDRVGAVLSHTFPLSYLSNVVRELMLAGYSPLLYRNSLILLAMGVVFGALATVCYGRKLRRCWDREVGEEYRGGVSVP